MRIKIFSKILTFIGFWNFFTTTNEAITLKGFHITIKSNNSNELTSIDIWNEFNTNYQRFILNNKNLINIKFESWDQIINYNNLSDDWLRKQVYNKFIKQINNKDNNLLPKNAKNYAFSKEIITRSIANINWNEKINSYGIAYLSYSSYLPTRVKNSIFATVFPELKFQNYFSVPYTIEPCKEIWQSAVIKDRLKIIPLTSDNRNIKNERHLIILAKQDNETLSIERQSTKKSNIKVFEPNNHLMYAILNHNIDDEFSDTNFSIKVNKNSNNVISKNYSVPLSLSLANNTSKIRFSSVNSNNQESSTIEHNYFVKDNSKTHQKNLIVMNEWKNQVKVELYNNDNWFQYDVNPITLEIDKKSKVKITNNNKIINKDAKNNYQIFYFKQFDDDSSQSLNSGQYLLIYDDKLPNFDNLVDFNNCEPLKVDFQKYLLAISLDLEIENLETNPSQFINNFINFQNDISNHNFITYHSKNKSKPWELEQKLEVVTLVNNWRIIFIGLGTILSLTIIIPIFIFIKKRSMRIR